MYVLINENGLTVPYNETVAESTDVNLTYEGQFVKKVVEHPFHDWKTGCSVYQVMKHNDVQWKITRKCTSDELMSFGIFNVGTHDMIDKYIPNGIVVNGVRHVKVGHSACLIAMNCAITADGDSLVIANRESPYTSIYLGGKATLRYTDGFVVVTATDSSRVIARHSGRASNINVTAYDNSSIEGNGVTLYCHGRSKANIEYVEGQNSTVHMYESSSGKFINITGIKATDASNVELYGSSVCTADKHATVLCDDKSVAIVTDSVTVTTARNGASIARDHYGSVTITGDGKHIPLNGVKTLPRQNITADVTVVDASDQDVVLKGTPPPLQRRPYARKQKPE